jgi:hypothetical protein
MPLSLRRGRVTSVVERNVGLARIEVDGIMCIAYPRLTGPVAVGDDVIVNVQARELQLGSGGFDVLYANLTRGLDLPADDGAHVMKLPYTPLQTAVRHVEEAGDLPTTIGGMPVVCCTVHSQLAPVCAGVGADLRVAYLQLPGGALPVALSDAVRGLRERGLIQAAVGVGACVEGDQAAVSIASALLWSEKEAFDIVVCAIGPGIVGTGSPFGHGAVAAAEAANAAAALGGSPILAVRASEADARERHRGVSHHTRAVLALCLGDVSLAWPANRPPPDWWVERPEEIEVDVSGWRDACEGLELSHMGRGPGEEALFFEAAFAAGRLARSRL